MELTPATTLSVSNLTSPRQGEEGGTRPFGSVQGREVGRSQRSDGTSQADKSQQAEGSTAPFDEALSAPEQAALRELQQRDRQVRTHEQAHIAAGGSVIRGAASYSYVRGPDGKNYAVGGEVSIDTSGANTPAQTLSKAEAIRRAALAPADPSATDRSVAAQAAQLAAQARFDIARLALTGEQGSSSVSGGQQGYLRDDASYAAAMPTVNEYA